MNTTMAKLLESAYASPGRKQLFYGCNNARVIADRLGLVCWDWTPQAIYNVEPWSFHTYTIPMALGCPAALTSEGREWIEPVITDPAQVHALILPDVYAGRTGEILREIQRLSEYLPADTQVRLPDIQSPLGVAELMWDQSFYLALLTNPEEIHILLSKITEFIILYILEIKRILGKRYCPFTFPPLWSRTGGYYVADDTNSLVDPVMHYELGVTYINLLTDELGPVHYHSCTQTEAYFDNIDRVKNKASINWSLSNSAPPHELIAHFSGKTVIAPHVGLNSHLEPAVQQLGANIHSEADLVRYLVECMQDNTTMYLHIQDNLLEKPELVCSMYRYFHELGCTPQAMGLSN